LLLLSGHHISLIFLANVSHLWIAEPQMQLGISSYPWCHPFWDLRYLKTNTFLQVRLFNLIFPEKLRVTIKRYLLGKKEKPESFLPYHLFGPKLLSPNWIDFSKFEQVGSQMKTCKTHYSYGSLTNNYLVKFSQNYPSKLTNRHTSQGIKFNTTEIWIFYSALTKKYNHNWFGSLIAQR